MVLFALAAAALLPPQIASDLRCVAILAVERDKMLAKDAAFYTAIVGADAIDSTGQSREAVRDLMIEQVRIVQAARPAATQIATCTIRMKARVAIERVTAP